MVLFAGTVVFGAYPDLIHARRATQTYGVRCCSIYHDGAPGRFWHDERSCYYTDAMFKRFVETDQLVRLQLN